MARRNHTICLGNCINELRRLFPAAVECGKLLFAGIIANSHTRATPVPNDRKFFSMNEDQ
jgi:hypothetical protein